MRVRYKVLKADKEQNEETESLKGKCLDAPDFYKNW